MPKINFYSKREKFVKIFPFFVFCCCYLLSYPAFSLEGQVEAVIQPLVSNPAGDNKNSIKFIYQGEKFEPPLSLNSESINHVFAGTNEYRFLLSMLDTIKTKDAKAFKHLWAKNEKSPNIYLEDPDTWLQFQDFIVRSPNIYLANKIYYGEYTVFQLMIESKQNNETVHRLKSYVVKMQDDKLVLTDDLAGDPGFKFIQLYSTYMGADFAPKR